MISVSQRILWRDAIFHCTITHTPDTPFAPSCAPSHGHSSYVLHHLLLYGIIKCISCAVVRWRVGYFQVSSVLSYAGQCIQKGDNHDSTSDGLKLGINDSQRHLFRCAMWRDGNAPHSDLFVCFHDYMLYHKNMIYTQSDNFLLFHFVWHSDAVTLNQSSTWMCTTFLNEMIDSVGRRFRVLFIISIISYY